VLIAGPVGLCPVVAGLALIERVVVVAPQRRKKQLQEGAETVWVVLTVELTDMPLWQVEFRHSMSDVEMSVGAVEARSVPDICEMVKMYPVLHEPNGWLMALPFGISAGIWVPWIHQSMFGDLQDHIVYTIYKMLDATHQMFYMSR
jgi:hypothetical protein